MEHEVRFSDGEVQWGRWMANLEFLQLFQSKEDQFVPDGMQVWWALPGMLNNRNKAVTIGENQI
jgi:hypothetical protein